MNKISPFKNLQTQVIFCVSFLFSVFCVKAQFPNPFLFNTATNAAGTGTIATGMPDLNWTAALTNSLGPYVSAVSCGNIAPGNWATSPFPNANWITYPHGCSANPAEHSCLGSTDEFYKLSFNLPATSCGQSVATPSTYCLSLDFFADNWVHQIFVNGNLVLNNSTGNPYNSWGFLNSGKITATMCSFWQAGINEVIVHIKSGAPTFPGYSGFLAQVNQTVNTTVGQGYNGSVSATGVSCFGGTNGSATVTIFGSNAGSTYTWLPSASNGSTATNLSAGVHTVIASNGFCSFTQTVNISQPPAFSISAASNVTLCSGSTATINAAGANSYTWSTGANTSSVLVNAPGVYTVTGSNQNGCLNSQTVSVSTVSPPSITINGSPTVCAGTSVLITASGASSYTWSNGAQNPTVSVSPQANTVYTVTGNASNSNCIASATFAVSVINPPVISISGNSAVCSGSTLSLTATGASNYTWSTGSTTSSITLAPAASAAYTVTGQSVQGCSSSAVANVSVNSLPLVSVSGSTVCTGQSATLIASGAGSYSWSTGQTGSIIPVTSAGVYSVTGTNSTTGCSNTATATVGFLPLPAISVNGNFTVCEGSAVNISATGASSFTWSTGANGNSINLLPVSSSQYTVSGTDQSTSCSNSQTFAVLVYQKPALTISGNQVLCGPGTVTLLATGADSYQWSTGNTSASVVITASMTQLYSVSGIAAASGCSNVAVAEVTVSNNPVLSVNNATVCAGHATTLTATGADNYAWSNGWNGSSIIVTPIANQIFTVTGFGSSSLCAVTKTVSVSVLPAPIMSIAAPTVICRNDVAMLTASGFHSFEWNTGDTSSTIFVNPSETSTYSVFAVEVSSGCVSSASVLIKVNPLPEVKILGDKEACDGEHITLTAKGAHLYSWEGVITNSLPVYVQENQLYVVTGTDQVTGCKNVDSIRVGTSPKCCEVFVPNTFTPDEDGLNDGFGAKSECKFREFRLYIFDKWGEQIFAGDGLHHYWNGYYKGKLCEQDVYVYLIRGIRSEQGAKPFFEKTGHVLLLTK